MQVILTQDVPNLGSLGDEAQVKNGYARNYLIPQGLAIPASGQRVAELRHQRHLINLKRQAAVDVARSFSTRIAEHEWVLQAKSGPGGRLFGSVNQRTLHQMLLDAGFVVERRCIQLPVPIRNLGSHPFTLRLHTEVQLEINVRVRAEGEEEAAALAAETEAGQEQQPSPQEEASQGEAASAEAPPDSPLEAEAPPPGSPPAETQG